MNVFALTVLVITVAVSLSMIKQIKAEYALIGSCLVALCVAALSLENVYPLFEYIEGFDIISENKEYLKCALKAIGVALLCSVASEICKDFGENALSFGIELYGKCQIIALTLPLIIEMLNIAKDLMG